jgi:hypothetical protein
MTHNLVNPNFYFNPDKSLDRHILASHVRYTNIVDPTLLHKKSIGGGCGNPGNINNNNDHNNHQILFYPKNKFNCK